MDISVLTNPPLAAILITHKRIPDLIQRGGGTWPDEASATIRKELVPLPASPGLADKSSDLHASPAVGRFFAVKAHPGKVRESFMKKGRFWALLPILVFLVLFIGSGIITGDFYAMPAAVGFLIALIVAFLMNPRE